MTEPIKCARIDCANNLNGECTFAAPKLYKQEAYVNCLDQTNKTE